MLINEANTLIFIWLLSAFPWLGPEREMGYELRSITSV